MTTTTTQRFVNLGKSRTQIIGPAGERILVMPFAESLHPNTYKEDATYVLEGEFWGRYVSQAGPLFPFPTPAAFGVESFPALHARNEEGELVELGGVPLPVTAPGHAVAARLGTYRIAADILTQDGKIKRELPDGTIELLEDTPENRTQIDGERVNVKNPEVTDGIAKWLERMHVDTVEKFNALSDDVMLKIPGITPQSLPHIRANMRKVYEDTLASEAADVADDLDPSFDHDTEETRPKLTIKE